MRVLLLDSWTAEAKAALAKVCEVYRLEDNWPDVIDTIDGVITKLNYCNMDVIAKMHNLRFLASCTTGLDHIDLDYCKSHDIRVLSLQGETDFLRDVHATAEHTLALILALIRKVPFAHDDVCQGHWDRERWQGSELHGKTVGVVGWGRVGRQVGEIVQAFGAHFYAHDPYLLPYTNEEMEANNKERWRRVLRSDVITVHVSLNHTSRGMFGEAVFRQMKPTAYFINTSRGAVVDEAALLCALREGTIAGAGLDVMVGEPLVNSDLVEYARMHDNLILTPHLGGNTAESRLKTQLFVVEKIRKFIEEVGK